MRSVNYKAIEDIKPLVREFDIDKANARLEKVSADEHYKLGRTLNESDAEAMITAIVEKYPSMVWKILSQKYIKNMVTLDVLGTFLEDRI